MTGEWPSPGGDDAALERSLRNLLFDQRTVVVSGRLDHERAGQAAVELMTLDADGDETIHLHLRCEHGDLDAAMALMDVVELVGVPVEVLCSSTVGGAAVGVLAVASRRLATSSASIRLVDPGDSFVGTARDQAAWAAVRADRWRAFCRRVATATGHSAEAVEADFEVGRWLDVDAAVEYGLVDEIVRRPPDRRTPLGFRPLR